MSCTDASHHLVRGDVGQRLSADLTADNGTCGHRRGWTLKMDLRHIRNSTGNKYLFEATTPGFVTTTWPPTLLQPARTSRPLHIPCSGCCAGTGKPGRCRPMHRQEVRLQSPLATINSTELVRGLSSRRGQAWPRSIIPPPTSSGFRCYDLENSCS